MITVTKVNLKRESRNCNINEPFCLMPSFDEMKLKRLLVDSLYLSPVCNLSPNPMIYCQLLVRTRASRAGQEISYHFRSSIFLVLQIWPRENVQPMAFGSARTVLKLPTPLGPILRAVLRQMSLKLLTDITGKTVQVNTFLTFSRLNLIFFFNFSGYFYTVAYHTRIFEMVGYSVSFVSILASLCILSAFR